MAVTGYDDEVLGEKVGVVVVPNEGESIELSDISNFLKEAGIAKYKYPEELG